MEFSTGTHQKPPIDILCHFLTGHSYQGGPTPSGLAVKTTRRGLGRNCTGLRSKNRLGAFRFRGARMYPAEETHFRDICGSGKRTLEGVDDLMMSGSGGDDMTRLGGDRVLEGGDGGQNPSGHESPQTDYGSITMFDGDEAWSHDQDEESCSELGLIPGSDYIGGTRVPDLVGQAAAPRPRSELYPAGSDEGTTLPIKMESVLGQSPKYSLEYLDDRSYGNSDDTLIIFEKGTDPREINVGATSNDMLSTPRERSYSSYDPTLEQLLPPFTEEGFFSDETIPSTLEHAANSAKCRRLEPVRSGNDGVIVVRCRAADVVKNGKIRWIDVSSSACWAKKSTPVWPLCSGRDKVMGSIERPPFPAVVKERSPIHGLSADTTVKTCFCVKDVVEVATLAAGAKFKGDVLVELFAKVLQNRTMDSGARQKFQFCDIFSVGPPFLPGEYVAPKACGPWDTDSRVFMGAAMVRVVGRVNKRSNTREWTLKIESIRDVDWDDVDWVRDIVCGNGKDQRGLDH